MFEDTDVSNNITIKHGNANYPIFKHKKFDQLVITEPITSTSSLKYLDLLGHTYYSTIYLPYEIVNGTLKATVKEISLKGFANNPNLKLIYGLENVETICDYAFINCPKLTGLILPNVKNIGEFIIAGSGIKIIDFTDSPLNGIVSKYALANSKLETVSFINTQIANIPSYCFAGDTNFRNFIIGRVDNSNNETVLWNQTKIKKIGSHAFDGCVNLDINIPNTVETFDEYAFANCTNLKINIFEGLKTIGPWCFWNCQGLVYVNIPKSVTSFGEGAFKTRTESKKLNVKFNWIDKDDIIPYDDDVWLFGQLIIKVPRDGEGERVRTMSGGMSRELNLINTNKYFNKGYGKMGKKSRKADKAEIENWGSDFNIPKITQKIQSQGVMLPIAGFDIVTNTIQAVGGGSYTVTTYVPATIYLQPTIHEAAIVAAEAAAQAAAASSTESAAIAAQIAAQVTAEAAAAWHAASVSAFAAIGQLNAYIAHTAAAAFSGVTGTLVYGNGVVAATATMAASNASILSAFGGATATVSQSIVAGTAAAGTAAGTAAGSSGAGTAAAGAAAGAGAAVGSTISIPVVGAIIVVIVVVAIITALLTCWLTGVFNPYVEYTTGYYTTDYADIYLPSGEIIVGNDDKTLKLTNEDFGVLMKGFEKHQKASDDALANEPATRSSRNYKQNLYPNVPPPIDFNPERDQLIFSQTFISGGIHFIK
ncbi:MAG: hypothetical protein EZS28_007219 [Streblomastix strix]|nr:MAG: hypothetical protein EZS28_007219 [Streblomastix strix]